MGRLPSKQEPVGRRQIHCASVSVTRFLILSTSTLKHLYDNNITNNIMMSGDSHVSTAHYCSLANC